MHVALPAATGLRALRLKRWGYLCFLLIPALPPTGWWLGALTGLPDLFAWWTPFVSFGLVPLADALIGTDLSSPDEAQAQVLERDPWYRALPLLALPVCAAVLAWGLWALVHTPLGWAGRIGHVASLGVVTGALGITAAHELIHKAERLDRLAGGWLLGLACYGSFKIEHVRGHHVNVATPMDTSSAARGQSLYHFLPRAIAGNVRAAWRLEAQRLRREGKAPLSRHNEVVRLSLLSAALAGLAGLALGVAGLAGFLAQAAVAITLLEIINYIEHYGLRRQFLPDGRWERTAPRHSWNAPHLFTNLLLFQLQRHSDHHAHARRRYSALRHHADVPTLPAGYAAMVLLALVPPLWFRVMHRRLGRP